MIASPAEHAQLSALRAPSVRVTSIASTRMSASTAAPVLMPAPWELSIPASNQTRFSKGSIPAWDGAFFICMIVKD